MATQIQVTFKALLCHQASADSSQESEVHSVFMRGHGGGAEQMGDRDSDSEVRSNSLRKLSRHYRGNRSRGH